MTKSSVRCKPNTLFPYLTRHISLPSLEPYVRIFFSSSWLSMKLEVLRRLGFFVSQNQVPHVVLSTSESRLWNVVFEMQFEHVSRPDRCTRPCTSLQSYVSVYFMKVCVIITFRVQNVKEKTYRFCPLRMKNTPNRFQETSMLPLKTTKGFD